MATQASIDQVQKFYIAYYGRPADPAGLTFWCDQLDAAGGDLTAIIQAFGTSPEATALFGGLTPEQTVNTLYNQLFNRDADVAGLNFYTQQLLTGAMTLQDIAYRIMIGAENDDAVIIANKLAVAKKFTDSLDTAQEILSYSGDVAAGLARDMLETVDENTDPNTFDVNATITVLVSPMVAASQAVSGDEDTAIGGSVTATDLALDDLVYAVTGAAANGAASIDSNTGVFTYTPNANFNGADSFTVEVGDGNGNFAYQTVNVTVNPVNDAPSGPATLAVAGNEDAVTVGNLTITDIDGDTLSYTMVANGNNGVASVAADGSFTYTPNADFVGADSFTVSVSDGNGGSVQQTVNVTVNNVNDAPVFSAGSVSGGSVVENNAANSGANVLNGSVTSLASDIDGDALTFSLSAGAANGAAVVNADGTFTYTPNDDYFGPDSFVAQVSDGNGGTDTITVNVTVTEYVDFVLTAGVDTVNGTDLNELIIGDNNNLSAGDNIDGGNGNDTLRVATDAGLVGTTLSGFTLDNTETVEVTSDSPAAGVTVDLSGAADVSNLTDISLLSSVNSTNDVTFNFVGRHTGGSLPSLLVDNLTTTPDVNLQFFDAVLTGGTDVVNAEVRDSTVGILRIGGITDNNGGVETVNLTANQAATTIGTLNTDLTTLNIFGSSNLTITNPLNNTVTAVNGSTATGNLMFSVAGALGSVTINTGSGADNVTGSGNADTISTDGGNDTVNAGGGNDTVNGGDGNDTLNGDAGNDTINGGNGADIINGGTGNDTLNGDAGADTINGGAGSDTINGGDDNDTIDTGSLGDGAGNEVVSGGNGDDVITTRGEFLKGSVPLLFSPKFDTFDGGAGNDTLNVVGASANADGMNDVTTIETVNLSGGVQNFLVDNLSPFDNDTTLVTVDGSGNGTSAITFNAATLGRMITLIGAGGNDVLTGGAGDDDISADGRSTVNGDLGGTDILIGNNGNDTFRFAGDQLDVNDTVTGGNGTNTIRLQNTLNDTDATLGGGISGISSLVIDNVDPTSGLNDVNITFNAAYTQGSLTVDGSALGLGPDQFFNVNATANIAGENLVILGGTDNDFFSLGGGNDNVSGGDGNDDFRFETGNLNANDTVDGGNGTADELFLNGGANYTDAAFANVSNVEIINATTSGGTLTIGANAQAAGIVQVDINTPAALTVNAGAFTSGLTINDNAQSNTVTTGSGDDVFNMSTGTDNFNAGAGNDLFNVNANGELDFTDTLGGGAGTDSVILQNGTANIDLSVNVDLDTVTLIENFTFNGSGSNITSDNHTVTFQDGNVGTVTPITIDGTAITDASDSVTVVVSGAPNAVDTDFSFIFQGSAGNDLFVKNNFGQNNDITFNGNSGNDTLRIFGGDMGATVTFDGGVGTDTVDQNGGAIIDDDFNQVSNVETLTGTLAAISATLGASAATAGIVNITGGAFNDNVLLDAAFTNNLAVNLSAGGNDTINGSATSVVLSISADDADIDTNDTIMGGSTAGDTLTLAGTAGGVADVSTTTGVESLVVTGNNHGPLNPTVILGATSDFQSITVVPGHPGNPVGSQHAVDLTIQGGLENDGLTITTFDGTDNITTGTGNDVINAGGGNDTITTSGGNNTINGEEGNDTITTGAGTDNVNGGSGNDTINVGGGNDTVDGGTGDDIINGGAGNDTLKGGTGNDTITGGGGLDTITLGNSPDGNPDIARYVTVSDSVGATQDHITDFESGTDRIQLETTVFNITGFSGINFVGNFADFSGASGAVGPVASDGIADIVFEQANNRVWVDSNDDGILNGLDLQIVLDGVSTLQAADFFFDDTVAPVAPTLDLLAGSDSGVSNSDDITSTDPVTVRVSFGADVVAGDTVNLTGGAAPIGPIALTAGDITNGYLDVAVDLTDNAVNNLSATITDQVVAGDLTPVANVSAAGTLTVTHDNVASAPSTPDLDAGSDSGTSSTDDLTKDTTPTFTGTGEAGSTVQVSSDVDGILGTTTVDGAGNWSFTAPVMTAGAHNISALMTTDVAGNGPSAASANLAITIDTTADAAPAALDLDAADDTGAANNDDITKNNTGLSISGTGVNGSTVVLTSSLDGQLVGSAVVAGGVWSIDVTLTEGTHSVTATQTDAAGNTSVASAALNVTVDQTNPAATTVPDLTAATDTGTSNSDNITGDNTPDFTGTAEANASVEVFSDVDGSLGTVTANGAGVWTLTAGAMTDGAHQITAQQTDVAGNVGPVSGALGVTIDTTPPAAPSTPDLADASDSGTSNSDDITNIQVVTVTGTGTIGETVTITSDMDGVVGSAVVDGAGNYSVTTAALTENVHALTASITDTSGNTGTSAALNVTVDLTAPTLSLGTSTPADGSSNTAPATATIDFSEAVSLVNGALVTLHNFASSAQLGATISVAGGDVVVTPDIAFSDLSASAASDYYINVGAGAVQDAAGNLLAVGVSGQGGYDFDF